MMTLLSPLLKQDERSSMNEGNGTQSRPRAPLLRSRRVFLLLPTLAIAGGISSWHHRGSAPQPQTFAECTAPVPLRQTRGAPRRVEMETWTPSGTPQEPVEWTAEEEILRQYSWTPPDVDASLQRVLDDLDEVSLFGTFLSELDYPGYRTSDGRGNGYLRLVQFLRKASALDSAEDPKRS